MRVRTVGIAALVATLAATAAYAGTEFQTRGHSFLGAGAGGLYDIYPFFGGFGGDNVRISVAPEYGYFFANRLAAVGVFQYFGVWAPDGYGDDDYFSNLELSGGAEVDPAVSENVALYFRLTAGANYDPEYDGGYGNAFDLVFGESMGAKFFIAPQTPLWFGYVYHGQYSDESGDVLHTHGVLAGFQIIF